jgi:hypothetical protein
MVAAFLAPWVQYDEGVPSDYQVKHEKEIKQIKELYDILVLPLDGGSGSITQAQLRMKLMNKNLSPLKFLCYSLGLSMVVPCNQNRVVPAKSKRHFADLLISYVSDIPNCLPRHLFIFPASYYASQLGNFTPQGHYHHNYQAHPAGNQGHCDTVLDQLCTC